MKTLSLIAMIVTLVLLGSTLVCGFWIRSQGAGADSIRFHMMIAVATAVATCVTMVLQYMTSRSA